jgi:Zn-dependent protease
MSNNIFLEFGMFLLQLLIVIPGIYLAVIPHEVMHGYIAMKNGDYTAKNMGRLTMNPLKHIDIFGSIIMPLLLILLGSNIIFAYAKPVPVNPLYFRNFKKGLRNTSLAGPGINLVIAFLLGSLYGFILFIYSLILRIPASVVLNLKLGIRDIQDFQDLIGNLSLSQANLSFFRVISMIFLYAIIINIFLAVFNFIPIPPLDGSKIVASFLPESAMYKYLSIGRIGFFIIFILLLLGGGIFWSFIYPLVNFLFLNLGFWWRFLI